jgi:hypothetical protein
MNEDITIRLGWNCLKVENTLAYHTLVLITAETSVLIQAPDRSTLEVHVFNI